MVRSGGEVIGMRWVAGTFYLLVAGFAGMVGGPKTALVLLGAMAMLMVILQPASAGRALSGWAHLLYRRRRVTSSA
jgi:hypothetical protein